MIHFETRNKMLSLIPEGGTIAELGVFRGDFAHEILSACKPKELFLIDSWMDGNVMSGDENGDNIQVIHGKVLYDIVIQRFSGNPEIKIIRDFTSRLLQFPDNYFDMIYIDASHEYAPVLHELKAAFIKTKSGGWIMGHDYEIYDGVSTTPYFGVRQAVQEFCASYSQTISVKALNRHVSFGIRVNK